MLVFIIICMYDVRLSISLCIIIVAVLVCCVGGMHISLVYSAVTLSPSVYDMSMWFAPLQAAVFNSYQCAR